MNRFPVLMFHRIVSDACPVTDEDELRYGVPLETFEKQLETISRRGQAGVSMDRVHERLAGGGVVPAEWVAMTFDDGNRSDYEHALPLLSARGFSATFYICGDRIGAPGGVEESMVREMREAGQHIASHAMSHRFLTDLDSREEEDELCRSRDVLSGIIGERVDHFAPPGGRMSARTLETVSRLGYRAVATSRFGYNPSAGARAVYRRIPVVRATSMRRFEDVLERNVMPLLPGYLRSMTLDVVRRLLGERRYGSMRERALGK